ncbi:MAG: phosphoesterase [Verrucomicrobiales bacterium]|nr:phosphoesterase [Verrucomicrobiales bacterium]
MKTTIQNHSSFDLIGDIHGFATPLRELLDLLGYRKSGDTYRHPEGRKVIFAGDFIDRGPEIRETLHLVRSMIDSDDAIAIMGNHEYNAVCFHTPDGKGDYLRSHTYKDGKNIKQHETTLRAFAGLDREWDEWIRWFRELPFYLDLGNLRVVHATWHRDSIRFLKGKSLADDDFLKSSVCPDTPEFESVEIVLKGLEIPLPDGNFYEDKQGFRRSCSRVKWWECPDTLSYRDAVFPFCDTVSDDLIDFTKVSPWGTYPDSDPPVFFGHYWIPASEAPRPQRSNIACLDYSVAKPGGKLVAYRWDGEQTLDSEKFVSGPS